MSNASQKDPTGASLFLLRDPRRSIWSLHPLAAEDRPILLGWAGEGPFEDSPIAACLARSFCRIFAVTFIHPYCSRRISNRSWQRTAEGWQVLLTAKTDAWLPSWTDGLTDWIRAFAGLCRPLPLCCTTMDSVALALFDSRIWDLGGQIVFLSSTNAPPDLRFQEVHGIFARHTIAVETLQEKTIQGLFFPGHDGDWLELYLWDPHTAASFENSLQESCALDGLRLEEVSESVFIQRLRGL